MKIAQVSPLFESVPPKLYGGTERVVSYLTEELVSLGHEVTLFASGDSVTGARLCPQGAASLRLDNACKDHLPHHFLLLEKVFQHTGQFDIVHFHIDYLHFPLFAPAWTFARYHAARPPGSARLLPLVPRVPGRARGFHLRCPAHPPPLGELAGNGPSRTSDDLPFPSEPGRVSGLSRPYLPGKGLDRAIDIASRAGIDR